ncbi:MAG: hypothetical protein HY706_07730 [Candidatus Hydrogenedentes bacterium]|nr:hypothetical protein [Candidatus Hydrogenedentota bacterium]
MIGAVSHSKEPASKETPSSPHQSDKARILFTPVSDYLAHVGRSVLLARELKARGHEIAFGGAPRYLCDPNVVSPGEFPVFPLPDFEQAEGLEVLRNLCKVPSIHVLRTHLDHEFRLLDEFRPDLIVCDFRLTMFISARVRNIPVVSLLGGRWLHQYADKPFRGPRTNPVYPWLVWMLGEPLTSHVVMPLQKWVMRYKIRPHFRLSRQNGLTLSPDVWEFFVGDFNLILDTNLVGASGPLPAHFRRVGPIAWTPHIPLPDWVNLLDRDRPIIYVTMGSTGHPDLFQSLITLLADKPYTVIISTGGQFEIAPASVPSNFRVVKYLPGEKIMALSDLVIFHGGAGTGYQAIQTGTPGIAIATHLEQEFIAEVLEEHRAGVFLTMREVLRRPSVVLRAIEEMLADLETFRAHMQVLRNEFHQYRPLPDSADAIEQFLRTYHQ